jgi:hypothetical protein
MHITRTTTKSTVVKSNSDEVTEDTEYTIYHEDGIGIRNLKFSAEEFEELIDLIGKAHEGLDYSTYMKSQKERAF